MQVTLRTKGSLTLAEFVFMLSFVVVLVTKFLLVTQWAVSVPALETMGKGIQLGIACVLILQHHMAREHKTGSYFLYLFIIAFICITGYMASSIVLPTINIMLIFSARDIPIEKIIRVTLITTAICMILLQGAYLLGFVDELNSTRTSGSVRYALGYNFTTVASNYFFYLVNMYIFLKEDRIGLGEYLALFLISFYFYVMTGTRSAFFLTVLSIALSIGWHRVSSPRLLNFLNKYIVLIGAIGSYLLILLYRIGFPLVSQLNNILSDRLALASQALKIFGVSLFGQQIDWILYGEAPVSFENFGTFYYLYVDSSFLNIAINYGLLFLGLIVFVFYLVGKRARLSKYYTLALMMIVIHAMFDPQFLEIQYNPFLLILGTVLLRREK